MFNAFQRSFTARQTPNVAQALFATMEFAKCQSKSRGSALSLLVLMILLSAEARTGLDQRLAAKKGLCAMSEMSSTPSAPLEALSTLSLLARS